MAFEGANYYIDTSHVGSIVQYSVEWSDPKTLRLVIELCDYGKRLSEMFQYAGQAPFDNVFTDHEIYLRAVLGENVEVAVEHFRGKVDASDPYEVGTAPAQALVKLFARLERFDDAVDVYQRHLKDSDPMYLNCPNSQQLCDMAGELQETARAVPRGRRFAQLHRRGRSGLAPPPAGAGPFGGETSGARVALDRAARRRGSGGRKSNRFEVSGLARG